MKIEGVYTTGQVAKICRVSAQTVNRWVDEGILQGYCIPGSSHRRVPKEVLRRFMYANSIPAEWLGKELKKEDDHEQIS